MQTGIQALSEDTFLPNLLLLLFNFDQFQLQKQQQ